MGYQKRQHTHSLSVNLKECTEVLTAIQISLPPQELTWWKGCVNLFTTDGSKFVSFKHINKNYGQFGYPHLSEMNSYFDDYICFLLVHFCPGLNQGHAVLSTIQRCCTELLGSFY